MKRDSQHARKGALSLFEFRARLIDCRNIWQLFLLVASRARCVTAMHRVFFYPWSGIHAFCLWPFRTVQVRTFAKLVGQSFEVQCESDLSVCVFMYAAFYPVERNYAGNNVGVGIRSRGAETQTGETAPFRYTASNEPSH